MHVIRKKLLAVSCSMAICISVAPANAGFLNDMYAEMSANANVTGARIYETQRAGVITGGGMVWKTPVRNFQPFGFTPPSYKAGCGGIDLFMGSFSMFSKDEFVQMLRAVGQNMAGLLFHTALAAISPELDGLIRKFSKDVTDFNKHFGNSCEMAKWITRDVTDLDKYAHSIGEQARSFGVNQGWWPDRGASEYDKKDGGKIKDRAPSKTNKNGDVVAGSAMNITWNVMKTGSFTGLSTADKEMLMSMLGTVITKWRDDLPSQSEDQYLDTFAKPALGQQNIRKWIGTARETVNLVPIKVYACDTTDECMNPAETDVDYRPLARTVYLALDHLRTSVIARQAPGMVDGLDPRSVVAMTSFPIGNIINMVTTPAYRFLGEEILKTYADAIAYDIATRLMEEIVIESTKAIKEYETGGSPAAIDMVNLVKGVENLKGELWALRDDVSKKVLEQNTALLHYNELERVVMGGMSKKVLASMRFEKMK